MRNLFLAFAIFLVGSFIMAATTTYEDVTGITAGGGGASSAQGDAPETWAVLHADFLEPSVAPYTALAISGGFATHSGSDFGTDHPGVVVASTSTGAAAGSGLAGQILYGVPDDSIFQAEIRMADLSTAGEEFDILVGFMNSQTAAASADGVFFEYNRTNSVNWQAVTIKDTTATRTDTSTVVAEDVWITFKIVYTSTSVEFYIDGSLVATNTTNILQTDDWHYQQVQIIKSAGTTARTLDIDMIHMALKADR